MTRNLAAALRLAADGLLVFPCRPTKQPYVKDWPNAGTKDPAVIAAWAPRWPDFLPALACGRNNLLVVDQDRHKVGTDGVV